MGHLESLWLPPVILTEAGSFGARLSVLLAQISPALTVGPLVRTVVFFASCPVLTVSTHEPWKGQQKETA